MDMDAVAFVADRHVDLAQGFGREADPRLAHRRSVAQRLDMLDHLAHPFLTASVEHGLLDVGGGGHGMRLRGVRR